MTKENRIPKLSAQMRKWTRIGFLLIVLGIGMFLFSMGTHYFSALLSAGTIFLGLESIFIGHLFWRKKEHLIKCLKIQESL